MKGVKGLTKKNVGVEGSLITKREYGRKNIGGTNRNIKNKRRVFRSVLFQLLAWAKSCHPWVGVSSAHIL